MDNLISVIIPTYNRAQSLPESIDSILDQSADNWELIIIDDGSNDDTGNIVQDYLIDERVNYYFQKNVGVSAARNKGVEVSRGDYIIFLDSDDRFLPGLFFKLNEINYQEYDMICWEVSKQIDGKLSVWKPHKLEKIYNHLTATFLAGSICYKKEIFLKAGGFDPKMTFGENYELGIRISNLSGLKIKILDQQYLSYSIDSKNRASSKVSERLASNRRLLKKHKELYRKDRLSLSRLEYQLGFLYEKQGNNQRALQYYTKAFKTRPVYLKTILRIVYLKIIGLSE
ncbi:glycosyltransferase [Salinimicrobium sp. WS361]|uniref:glycosyltransferase n=1 Tax=Salinimicrobium sp. WS361 TaxID=3425123 RepID=UPI003D6FF395